MSRTLLVIGGGVLQVPVIQTAQDMGYNVAVMDMNPEAPGMFFSNIPIVVSTRDIRECRKAARKLKSVCGVLTVGTDVSMTVAAIAEELKLPGHSILASTFATNKGCMRNQLRKSNLLFPKYYVYNHHLEKEDNILLLTKYPAVFKPSDNMGARGISVAHSYDESKKALQHALEYSENKQVVIEEYIEGPELSIDAIVHNGVVTITGVADRIIKYPPYFVEIGHTMPSQLPAHIIEDAKIVMGQGIRSLGLTHGCAKGDIKISKDGAMIIELAARLSGGFMSTHTYPLSTGVNLMQAAVRLAVGEAPGDLSPTRNLISIERAIISEKEGILKSITGIDQAINIDGIMNIFITKDKGQRVAKPKSNVEKIGHIIAIGKTLEEAETAVKRCRELITIEVEDAATGR